MNARVLRCLGLASIVLAVLLAAPAQAVETVVYYHTDALHSVAVVTNAQGQVIERTHYAPYGQVLNRARRDGPGYGGHEEDAATGLVYMQQRYYDPEAGRFLSADPVPAGGGSFNRYAYAANNPYRYVDPDGRASKDKSKKQVEEVNKPCTGSHIGGQACGSFGPLSPSLLQMDQGPNLFQIVGKAIATDIAYVQGLVTHNQALIDEASNGFKKEIGTKTALAAVFALGTMGRGGGAESSIGGMRPAPGTRVRPSGVPENWRIGPTETPGGVKYSDPRNAGNQVRVMQGNPNSPYPNSRGPYVRQLRNGQWLDAQGNPVSRTDPAGHIPLDQYPGYQQ